VAGNFNAGKLKSVFTSFVPACLDFLYYTHWDAYKALPHPPFGKSDHNLILQIPAYKQKLKQEVPVTHSIRKWLHEADAKLQEGFACTTWNMFWDSSNGIEEFTTSVTGFINKCTDDDNVYILTRSHGLQATSTLSSKHTTQSWRVHNNASTPSGG
jgi:hypothetical protein